ncbi:MAG: hypothetical protein R2794_00925 [Chitinophagales bacterium]
MENKQKNIITITTSDGKPFKVPVEGSLGLLALGYKGLVAWRQARRQYQKTMKEQNNTAAEE